MKNSLKSALLLGSALIISSCSEADQQTAQVIDFDIMIDNGTILDGKGGKGWQGDVGIRDGKIVAMGPELNPKGAKLVVNALGQVVAPGFIDLHSHAEQESLLNNGFENNLYQGITTILGGNCGTSPVDVGGYKQQMSALGMGLNMGLLIGHNSVRLDVMGNVDRAPTAEEQAKMEDLIQSAMSNGTFGMSTGLKYMPGAYSETSEVVALAKVSGKNGGIYTSHMREEGLELISSVEEVLEIGRKAELPVHISHHKAVGKPSWGKPVETLKMVDDARETGLDVTLDQYPYAASSTTLTILFPAWSLEGTDEEVKARLANPETRAKVKAGIINNIRNDRGGDDPARVYVAEFKADPSLDGKNLAEISVLRGRTTSVEDGAETLMELISEGGGMGIFHAMHDDDVRMIMKHPMVSIATDGHAPTFGEASPHPRNYGTFARVLGYYSREEGVLTLPEAIRKMTSLPASRMGLTDRGVLATGNVADIVVFNADTVIDKATFAKPHQYAEGFSNVFVNGVAVIKDGKRTSDLPGKMLKGPGYKGTE